MHCAGSCAAGETDADIRAGAIELQALFAGALVQRRVPDLDERISLSELQRSFAALAIERVSVLGDADRREANIESARRPGLARGVANECAKALRDRLSATCVVDSARECRANGIRQKATKVREARAAGRRADHHDVAIQIALEQPRNLVSVGGIDCAER